MMFRTGLAVAACALCLGATAASATATDHMSDMTYIAAARCQALMGAPNLGPVDTHAIDALVRQQERSRTEMAYDAAQDAREKAANQARHAGADEKAQLISERDGVCRAMLGSGAATSGN